MRYTKQDAEGNYYIESKDGALTSDTKGRTYGPAIDQLAVYENREANDYFTPEEVRKMSQAEVRENYQKILNSMKFWNEGDLPYVRRTC